MSTDRIICVTIKNYKYTPTSKDNKIKYYYCLLHIGLLNENIKTSIGIYR